MASKFSITAELNLQTKNLNQVVNNLKQKFQGADLNIKIKDLDAAQNKMNAISKSARSASQSMGTFGDSVGFAAKKFGAITLATGTFVGLARAIKNSLGEALDFEKEMVKVASAAGKTVGSLKSLEREIGNVSSSFGVSSKELVSATRNLVQAGFAANKVQGALKLLAQTELSGTFDSITDTTEGVIAILNQFGREAQNTGREIEFLERSLSAISKVSKDFAVESGDLITAIRTTGSAFQSAGGDLDELIAIFTSIRSTTRESAESISTGLRTIFTRVQRVDTINTLKQLGIELQDTEGKFIGPLKAAEKLSAALNAIDPKDFRFNVIVEELGGFRQVSKVIPLIQQYGVAVRALDAAQKSSGDLAKDSANAQKSLSNQISKTREEFKTFIRELTNDASFRQSVTYLLDIASAFLKIADSLKPLLPLISAFTAVRIGNALLPALGGLSGFTQKKAMGGPIKFAKGGMVPGTGNGDTVPAMLTPGEFVIRKSSVKKLGAENLAGINKYGIGGKVGIFDRDKIEESDNDIFKKIINEKKYRIVYGASGAGKTTYAQEKIVNKRKGSFLNAESNLEDFSEFLILTTANPTEKNAELFQNSSGIDVLDVSRKTINDRRRLRFNAAKAESKNIPTRQKESLRGDKRTLQQLENQANNAQKTIDISGLRKIVGQDNQNKINIVEDWDTHFAHLDKMGRTKTGSKLYSSFGIDLPAKWNADWDVAPNNQGPTSGEFAEYIRKHDIFKTLKKRKSSIYKFGGEQADIALEILKQKEKQVKEEFANKVRVIKTKSKRIDETPNIFDTDAEVISKGIGDKLIQSFPEKVKLRINKNNKDYINQGESYSARDILSKNFKNIVAKADINPDFDPSDKSKKYDEFKNRARITAQQRKELENELNWEEKSIVGQKELNKRLKFNKKTGLYRRDKKFLGGEIQKFALGGAAEIFDSALSITIPDIDTYTFNKPAGEDLDGRDRTGGGSRRYKVNGSDKLEYDRQDKKIDVNLLREENKISRGLYSAYINETQEDIRGKIFEKILLESKLAKTPSRLQNARLDGISASGNPFEAKSTKYNLGFKEFEEKLWGAIIDKRSEPEVLMRERMNANTWTDKNDIFNVGTIEVFQDITRGLGKEVEYEPLMTEKEKITAKNTKVSSKTQTKAERDAGRNKLKQIIDNNLLSKWFVKDDYTKQAINKEGEPSVAVMSALNKQFGGKKFDEVVNELSNNDILVALKNILTEEQEQPQNKNLGGFIRKFASGGYASGTDTVPAMLTPGEFVVNKKSAQAIGYSNLHRMNKVGKFANGGPVGVQKFGVGGDVDNSDSSKLLSLLKSHPFSFAPTTLIGKMSRIENISTILKDIESAYAIKNAKIVANGAESIVFDIGKKILKISQKDNVYNLPRIPGVAAYSKVKKFGPLTAALQEKLNLDKYATPEDVASLKEKMAKSGRIWSDAHELNVAYDKNNIPKIIDGSITKIKQHKAKGGSIGTDTVPAMLTPGEYVINKKSAEKIGYSSLNRMNKVGKFANGGPVGVQHLAAGDIVAGQTFLKAAGYTGKATGVTGAAYEAELLKASKILTELSKSGLSTEGALKKLIDQVTKQGTAFQLSSSQVKSFEKAIEIATNKQNAQKAATTKAIEEENKAIESTSTKLLFLASVVGNSAAEYSSLEQEYKSGVQSAISSLAITKSVFEQVAVSVDDFFSSYSKLSPFIKDFASGMKSGVNAVSFLASAVNGYSAYIQASAEKGMKASEESLKKTKETGVLPDIDKIKSQYKGIGESVRMQQAAMTATNPLYQVLGLSIAGGISVGAGALKRKGYSYGGNVDTIDAKLTAGEYIIRKQAVDHYGTDFLDSINKQKYKYNKGGKVYKFASGGTFGKILKGGAKLIGSGLAMGAVSAAPGAIAGAFNYSSNQNLPAEFEKLGQSLAQSAISLYKFNKILQELETIKSEKITKTQEDLYSNFVSVQERVQYFRSEFEKGNLSVAPILEKAEEEAAQLKEAFRKLGDELNKRTTQDFSRKAAAGFQVSEKDIIDSSKNIATPFNKIIVNLGKKLEAASTPEEAKSIHKQIFETAQERDKSVEADKISKAKTIKQSYELAAQMKREENLRNSLIGTLAQEQAIRNASTKAMFQFESVSSKIARIGGDFANFSSIPTPESLSAGGGTEELSQSLSFVTKVLGSSGAQLSQNFIDLQDSVKIIDTAFLELDKGIGQDINFEKFFEDYFKSQTGRSGGTVTKKIAEFIKETLGGKDQTKGITPGTVGSSEAVKSIRQKIKEYEESLREQLTAIISVFSEFDKSLNQPLQKIVESTQTISELQVQSAESLGKYIDLMAKMYGKDVSLRQKDQLRASRQSILGGKAGGNPAALLKNIRSATDQRNILQESSFKNALSGGVEGIVNFKRQMAGLDSSINNSKKALAELADQSDRTSDIMDQFQKEEEKRKTVQEYGKSFTFAGKEERYNQAKAIEAARTAFMTGDITSIPEEMRKSVEQLLDNFKDIELFGSGMTGEDISKQLQYRELVKSGVAPNAAQSILTRTDPQEKLIRELQNTFASEQAARNALAQVEFDSQAELNTSIQQLSAIALQYLSEIQKGKIEAERQTSGARGALQNQGIAPAPTTSPAEFDRMAASLATSIEKFEKTMENILARAENLPPAQNKAKGGIVYRQSGGSIFQPKGTDTVPAMLTPGEFVMPVSAVNKYGTNMLENMRAGKYAKGGLVSYLQYGGRVDYVNQLMQRQMATRQNMMQNQMGSRLAWMSGQSGYSPRTSRRANREAVQEQVQSNYEQQVAAQANNGEGLTPNQRVASTVAGGTRVVTDVRNRDRKAERIARGHGTEYDFGAEYDKNKINVDSNFGPTLPIIGGSSFSNDDQKRAYEDYKSKAALRYSQSAVEAPSERQQAEFMAGYYGNANKNPYTSTEELQKNATENRMAIFARQSYEKQKAEIEANQLKYQERQLQKVKDKSRLDADLLQSQKLVEYNKQLQEYNNKDWFSRQFSSAPVDPRKNTAESLGVSAFGFKANAEMVKNSLAFRSGTAPGQGEGDLLDRGLEFTRSAGIGLGNSATGLADFGAMGIDFAARQAGVTGNYANQFMGGIKDVAFGSGAKNRAGYLTGETIGNLAQMGRGSATASTSFRTPFKTIASNAKGFGVSTVKGIPTFEGITTLAAAGSKLAGYEDVGNIIDVASLAATFRGGRSAAQGADIADTPSSTTKFAEFLEKRNQNKNDKLVERLDSFIAKKMGQSSSDATRSLATEALANKKLYSSNPDLYYKNISQGVKRTAGGTLIPSQTKTPSFSTVSAKKRHQQALQIQESAPPVPQRTEHPFVTATTVDSTTAKLKAQAQSILEQHTEYGLPKEIERQLLNNLNFKSENFKDLGQYNRKLKSIRINEKIINDPKQVSPVLSHELGHAILNTDDPSIFEKFSNFYNQNSKKFEDVFTELQGKGKYVPYGKNINTALEKYKHIKVSPEALMKNAQEEMFTQLMQHSKDPNANSLLRETFKAMFEPTGFAKGGPVGYYKTGGIIAPTVATEGQRRAAARERADNVGVMQRKYESAQMGHNLFNNAMQNPFNQFNGMSMNHALNVDGQLNIGGINGEAIASQIKEGLGKYVAQIVMNMMKNQGIKNTNPNGI